VDLHFFHFISARFEKRNRVLAMDGWTMMDIFLGMMDFKDDGYFFFDVGQIFVQDEHKSKNDRRISEDVEQSHGLLKIFCGC